MAKINISKKRKTKIITGFVFLAILTGLVFLLLSGGNINIIKGLFKNDITKEEVRELLSSLGIRGYITISILSMLQVVFTFLPAEPVQVMAGVSFGLLRGVAACVVGVFVGNTFIYIVYKLYGQRLTKYFENNLEFDFEAASKSSKIALVIFILYFLPAIPYGLICFFAASLNIKYPKYILLTILGAIPSIFIGVGLGHLAIASSWILSLAIFLVLVVVIIILLKNKKAVFKKVNDFIKKKEQRLQAPKKPNRFFMSLLLFGINIFYCRKLKVKLKNNVGKLEKPSIVLCNHGSFIDFIYAGKLIHKSQPHFICARLYFYHKYLRKLLKTLGAVPKSMFSADMENVKNCLKLLALDDVIAMMPEARLSTVGKFEGIQDSTYKFIKRSNVTVYTVKLCGDYLASPKWGDGVRRGSYVTAELNKLFSVGELKDMPIEDVKQRIDSALYYDEFKWLETQPNIKYKCKTIAEGLENILYKCPVCGEIYSITTSKNTLSCSKCNFTTSLTDRYQFTDNTPFNNFAEWYDWQKQQMEKDIISDPYFTLSSNVELRHSSIDGKSLTRLAGNGVCTLNKDGLTYKGNKDGVEIEKFFPLSQIYRLLFGAGENFEIYEGSEIWYFVPEERRSAVMWYIASELLKKHYDKEQ